MTDTAFTIMEIVAVIAGLMSSLLLTLHILDKLVERFHAKGFFGASAGIGIGVMAGAVIGNSMFGEDVAHIGGFLGGIAGMLVTYSLFSLFGFRGNNKLDHFDVS